MNVAKCGYKNNIRLDLKHNDGLIPYHTYSRALNKDKLLTILR